MTNESATDVLSRFVRTSAAGEPLDDRLVEQVWHGLRAILIREIRRRGLWDSPPSYLGVVGFSRWSDQAVDDLVADCFAFVFIHRLRSLIARADLLPDVTGLIVLLVRNFIHDRQRQQDPLGFRIFNALRSSVRQAIDRGELFVLEGDPGIRNDTLLGFSTGAACVEPPEAKLAKAVRAWNDDLLPDLITASGRQWQLLNNRLRHHLQSLRAGGIAAFRFRQLLDPLKADVRARWAALWSQDQGEAVSESATVPSFARLPRPDQTFEERDRYEKLSRCVSNLIETAGSSEKERQYLRTLWDFLRAHAAGRVDRKIGGLSYRRLAVFLGIPRARFSGLLVILGELIQRCDQTFEGMSSDSGALHRAKTVNGPVSEE